MRRDTVSLIAFPSVAIALAAITSSVSADLGVANVAVGLAALTTIAGVLAWPAGVATSISAALALNYFHTSPKHSLRIGSTSDIVMVVLLGVIGLTVSVATALRTRRHVLRFEHDARAALDRRTRANARGSNPSGHRVTRRRRRLRSRATSHRGAPRTSQKRGGRSARRRPTDARRSRSPR